MGPVMDNDLSVQILESLIEDFKDRLRRGESPSVLEYAQKNPDFYTEIIEIFPTIESMEDLKNHKEHSNPLESAAGKIPFSHLGEYRIIREIGRGGMGIVYEAFQESLNRSVAVKVLPWLTHSDENALKRFNREAQVAAGLEHPNIIPIFGFGVQGDTHYFAMRYIRGVGLEKLIYHLSRHGLDGSQTQPSPAYHVAKPDSSRKNLLNETVSRIIDTEAPHTIDRLPDQTTVKVSTPWQDKDLRHIYQNFPPDYYKEVAGLISQIARALHNAHSQGALHRDIKPANLLLDTQGVLWLADFGIAKMDTSETLTVAGRMLGTIRYMAPELFDGTVDAKSDLYSLGLVLYELITLRPAFTGQGSELMHSIISGKLTPPQKVNPYVPKILEDIILKAVAASPGQRYGTGQEMAQELDAFHQGHWKAIQPLSAANMHKGLPKQEAKKDRFFSSNSTYFLVAAIILLLFMFFYGLFQDKNTTEKQSSPVIEENTEESKAESASIADTTEDSTFNDADDATNREQERRNRRPPPERRRSLEDDNRRPRNDRQRDDYQRRPPRRRTDEPPPSS